MTAPRRRYPSDHRAYFRVMESILDDERLNSLDLADQMLFMRLLATLNRQESRDGAGFLPWRAAAALALRYRPAYVKQAFSRLHATGLVTFSYRDAGVSYTVAKWAKIQGFAPTDLRLDSDAAPLPRGKERRPEERSPKRRPLAAAEIDPSALAFATDFRSALERVHPGFKPPTTTAFGKWVSEARTLLRERPEAEVRSLASWLFDAASPSEGASFWRSVVLSVPKFREKYDQLAARRRQEGERDGRQRSAAGPGTSPLAERARAILRARRDLGGFADASG